MEKNVCELADFVFSLGHFTITLTVHGLKFSVATTDFSLLDLIEFNMSSMAACHAPKIDNLQAYKLVDCLFSVIHHFEMILITDIS